MISCSEGLLLHCTSGEAILALGPATYAFLAAIHAYEALQAWREGKPSWCRFAAAASYIVLAVLREA